MRRSFVTGLSLLFAASWAFPADPTSEELFKKVAAAWSSAKTLHVKDVKAEIKDQQRGTMNVDASLWIEEGNHVNLELAVSAGGQSSKLRAVCDGTTYVLSLDGREAVHREATKEFSAELRSAFLSGGVFAVMTMLVSNSELKDGKLSDFKPTTEAKVGDRAATVPEYDYTFPNGDKHFVLAVKLFVDKEKLQVLKREASDSEAGTTVNEEYPLIEAGSQPPADAFKLP